MTFTLPQLYQVQQNDTLSSIALKFYNDGSSRAWIKIYIANILAIGPDPDVLPVNITLLIPPHI